MKKDTINAPLVLRYVYAILAIVVFAGAIVIVSLYVAQQSELETRDRIQFVHFDSVSESAELAIEARALRQRVLDRLVSKESDHPGAAGIQSVQIGYRGLLQSMRSRLLYLSNLEEQSNDEIVALALERLTDRFGQIDRTLRSSRLAPDIITSIDVLRATIEQYDRLHRIAAQRELRELEDRQRQRPQFLAVLVLCFGLSALAASYLVRSLSTSLKRQEATEQALAESRETLHHIQKLDALGRLVGGIAHDFNNWLTVILGHTDLLHDQARGNERLETGLDEIKQAGLRAASLTQQLLALGRRQQFHPRVLDMNELIQGMEEMLQLVVGADVTLVFSYADELFDVELDPDQVQHVILNLVINARDAMPDGGLLSVITERITAGPKGVEIDEVPDGEYATLIISDTGIGMDDDTRERVFEPFFTTKAKGQGTGLGLSIVHGIVTASGGHLFVESREGKGTRFIIYFPRAELHHATALDVPKAATLQNSYETVLVVDDNEQVRRFVEKGLAELGYHVMTASGGAAGLAICRDESVRIDVIVSDVVMPETTGPRFMAAALKLRPDTAAIYMSAHAKDEILQFRRSNLEAGIPLITKPFKIEALSQLIREQLEKTIKP